MKFVEYNFEGNDGVDYFLNSNLNKKKDNLYVKINEKYFKLKENNHTQITINLVSSNDIFNIEVNNGSCVNIYLLIMEKYLHEFFEGNTISG